MDKQLKNTDPPKWADRFFEWYCNPGMQEEIQGDLYESFMDRLENGSLWQAKFWYWLQVILFINRRTLSRKNHYSTRLNSIDMFRSYFKIGYRNILKNKGTTFINAFGMALAIGCCLVVFQFVDFMYGMDDFHTKRDEIYVVQRIMQQNGEQITWNDVPLPLGKALADNFPQLENMVRIEHSGGVVEYKDKVISQWVSFVDEGYFELLDFPIKWGNVADFSDPEGLVLSKETAEKYFGSNNPIGEALSIQFNEKGKEIVERFIVKGVLDKRPKNASFSCAIMIPYQRQKVLLEKMEDWTTTTSITFVQAKTPQLLAEVKAKTAPYLKIINDANEDWNMVGLHFQPFKHIQFNNIGVRNPQFGYTDIAAIYFLISVACILLLLVCFNYINITLATTTTRLKEISVRKVMGSTRQQIIWQFLTENILICFISLVIGILLAHSLFFPWFNSNLGDMNLQLSFLEQPNLWLFVVVLTLITAIGGAGYPALYISKFQPNALLKKEFKIGTKNGFRKVLISIQLIITTITVFSSFAVLLDSKEQQQRDWGYNQKDLAIISLENGSDFDKFKKEIQSHPNVLAVTGSREQLGVNLKPLKVEVNGEEYDVQTMKIDEHYLNTFEMTLLDGRNFDKKLKADPEQSVLVNEQFRKIMNWEQAEGRNFKIGSKMYQVIGEVKDFRLEDFYFKIKPMVLQMATQEDLKYVTIRGKSGTIEATAKALESNWKKIYPHSPYNFSFQDGVFFWFFEKFRQTNSMLSATAFMTILISIIGFFGLAMLLLNRKMKEISIRKVLGANFFEISHLINKEFFLPLLFSILIGLPLAYFFIKGLLNSVLSPDSIIGILPFFLTIGTICLMVMISLAKHIYTAAVSNPSQFLKDE